MEQTLEYEILGIGNALIDIFAAVDEEVGPLFGLYPGRAVHVDYQRLSEIAVALPDPVIGAGGGAANTIKLAALLGLSSAFIGAVGSDPNGEPDRFARIFEQELQETGVKTFLVRGTDPTGACAVIRMPGDTISVAAAPSAALSLQAEDIDEKLIQKTKLLVLDGFLLPRKALVNRVFTLAERYGTVIALDVASVQLAAEYAEAIAEYAQKFPIILFMNEDEAAAFCCSLGKKDNPGAEPYACSDEDEAAEALFEPLERLSAEDIFPVIVVKRGPKGSLVYASGNRHVERTRSVLPFDSNGAGDAFAAGFLTGYLKGRSLAECAALGNKAAKLIIHVPGTNPDHEHFKKIVKNLS